MGFQPATRVAGFSTSIFTEITELAERFNAVDLSTGFPDVDGPEEIKAAAVTAMQEGRNQYALSHGIRPLREAIARHAFRFYRQHLNPDTQVTVTNGAAEALHSAIDGLVNPGDEVIILEPFYEVYAPNVIMAGGIPRYVPLRPPGWTFDPDELVAAFNIHTRAILINTPHNPTGKVFGKDELELIAALCQQWNVIAITDEVYEHIIFGGALHHRLAQVPGMADRTLTISSMSKTFSFTGWRVGWATGPTDLTRALRLAHQYVLDCSATPLQYGAARALDMADDYYTHLATDLEAKRDFLLNALREAGFTAEAPASAYFIMAGIEPLGFKDDFECCKHLAAEVGVAAIPPSPFYSALNRRLGQVYVRFAFCKRWETLEEARTRLQQLGETPRNVLSEPRGLPE